MRPETSYWHPYSDVGSVRHSELVLERGEDVWVWDTDGNRYFDATAGLWYANVGHGRPEIRAAVAAQMERLEACSAFFDLAYPPVLELAAALAERAPMPTGVFFGSGGSDGIDTAAKLARRYWREVGERDRTGLSHHSGNVISPKIESDEPLSLELADFVDAICSGERMEYQTAIARSVVRLVEAAEQSLREGGQEIAVEQNLRENHLVAASGWAVL